MDDSKADNNDNNTKPRPRSPKRRPKMSFGFLALVFIMLATGYVMYTGVIDSMVAPFIFVVAGWMVALCLHEFGHAFVAYHGGDRQVAQTGYLTLDPLSYTHPVYSLLLPALFIIIGFIALPGGAVYVHFGSLKNRYWESATSAGGPLMTLFCLCAVCAPFAMGLPSEGGQRDFWFSLALLAGFLALSLIWNLLPIPGLDGWGIIEPYLSPGLQNAGNRWRELGPTFLFIVIILVSPVLNLFWKITMYLLDFLDVPGVYFMYGMQIFRFWS